MPKQFGGGEGGAVYMTRTSQRKFLLDGVVIPDKISHHSEINPDTYTCLGFIAYNKVVGHNFQVFFISVHPSSYQYQQLSDGSSLSPLLIIFCDKKSKIRFSVFHNFKTNGRDYITPVVIRSPLARLFILSNLAITRDWGGGSLRQPHFK